MQKCFKHSLLGGVAHVQESAYYIHGKMVCVQAHSCDSPVAFGRVFAK